MELHPPPEFANEISISNKPRDNRSDAEIIESLTCNIPPVSSEKNVWAFWHSGFTAMPAWCQRNVVGWVRKLGPEWTVRVLDKVPDSPANTLNFVPASMLPEAFSNGTMKGTWVGQHSADMFRTASIYRHGGVWIDVGCILFMHLDHICWDLLEDPTTPYEVCVPHVVMQSMANNFIAARKGSEFVLRWHQLFSEIWKGKQSCDGLSSHPLMAKPPPPDTPATRDEAKQEQTKADGFAFDFKVPRNVIMDYVAHISAFEKVCLVKDPGEDGFDGPWFWSNKVLTFKSIDEVFGADKLTAFDQQALFDMLVLPVDSTSQHLTDAQRELHARAQHLAWHMIARTAMFKVYNGKALLKKDALGEMWTKPENAGADCSPGTFAALMRQASLEYEQKRKMPHIEPPEVQVVVDGPLLG